ncbi:MAG: hypothetical protein UY18_C0006G0014 [Microgenomates group bacterium GW2011_GWF2_47_9]|nr:MAG: hypothetical protein UY18_C0006G0014 [Microgenomates group bacterium GW2011_GWF2_47_9]
MRERIVKPVKAYLKSASISVVTKRSGLTMETILLFVLPLAILRYFPQIIHFRHLVMASGLAYVLLIARALHMTREEMGLTTQGFTAALLPLLIPTSLVLIFSAYIAARHPAEFIFPAMLEESRHLSMSTAIFLYVTLSVPLQEVLFRAFYIPRLEQITDNRLFLITFSALIFMLVHIPLGNLLMVLTTGLMGIIWADNFLRFRSLPAIMVSHALLGSFLIYLLYAMF